MRVVGLVLSVTLFSFPLFAQKTTTTATSDPQAVAVVQAAITALGGATAIGSLQSWTFQAQAEGRIANGTTSEILASAIPQNFSLKSGTTAKAPPFWAKSRSLFVPALVSAILVKQSQNPNFALKQAATSRLEPNSTVIVFSVTTKAGTSVAAQKWYFDSTTNLPKRTDFVVPASVGQMEAFPGTVTFSDYHTIGGVLYPFQIVTLLGHENAREKITLQSVVPSTTIPSASAALPGGVQ
jgi:hypothetical protein